jgi:hypothetical protein
VHSDILLHLREKSFVMKVLQHTAVRLTIQERLIGLELLSVATGCTGIFMFFLFEPPVDWIGAFCIALSGIFMALAPTETLTFDKAQKSLTIRQRRLLRQTAVHHPIMDVTAVEVNTLDLLGTRFYRIQLKMTSGRRLAVSKTMSTDWQQQQAIVRHIRGFLHPPTHRAPKNMLPSANLTA